MRSSSTLRQKGHGVPLDLIEDILGKLPVKSLVRFKCVSEQWFRVISDPRFIDLHLSNQWKKGPGFVTASSRSLNLSRKKSSRSLRCYVGSRSYIFLGSMVVNRDSCTIPHPDIRLVSAPKDDDYEILNSCDGILCFHGRFNIWVHNPATKEYRLLPSGPWCSCHRHLGLGFGRDVVTKRYKIVRLCSPCQSETGQDHQHRGHCVVFTWDPNPNACWKTFGEVPYKVDVDFSKSVYVNGAIYWFTDKFYHLNHNQAEVIVMFDLHTEKFQAIPHPSGCSNKPRGPMQLGTLRECLCLAQLEGDSQLLILIIWIMEKRQQKITWEKLYCIELFRDMQLLIGPRFAFAEHKVGTLLVYTRGIVYLCKPNNEIRCLWHGDAYRVPTAFNESLLPVYGRTVTQLKRGVIACTESFVPIYRL